MSDMELAARSGARGILIKAQASGVIGDEPSGIREGALFVLVPDFWTATQWIVQHFSGKGTLQ
jgi:hypothetical protein